MHTKFGCVFLSLEVPMKLRIFSDHITFNL